jgi:EAL and modified HD-GYP domain-containing signal transduction protein
MVAFDSSLLPLVQIEAVANARNEWVALMLQLTVADNDPVHTLRTLFDTYGLLAAIDPLDCVLLLDSPSCLTPDLLDLMPPKRVILAIGAAALAHEGGRERILALHDAGYQVLLDGPPPPGVTAPPSLSSISFTCGTGGAEPAALQVRFGPHLARRVDSMALLGDCERAGFTWFSGSYPIRTVPSSRPHDGSARKRLLELIGLLARDAESSELEILFRQDPKLSYHLLKLVNSAEFAYRTPITSFGQAITLLGRRQLQRWLQLLLYARGREDGLPNLLLPLAAVRAAQMETLCRLRGGDSEQQELAFMAGVFSLLDVLLACPMDEIVGALSLAPEVAAALLRREGVLGAVLRLVEQSVVDRAELQAAAIAPAHWCESQLHGYRWAVQLSRNV